MCEKELSHRDKAFVSLLEDTHLGTQAAAQNGSLVLHITVAKINKLLVCRQMCLS